MDVMLCLYDKGLEVVVFIRSCKMLNRALVEANHNGSSQSLSLLLQHFTRYFNVFSEILPRTSRLISAMTVPSQAVPLFSVDQLAVCAKLLVCIDEKCTVLFPAI